jgi:hypothetical protein
MPSSSRQSKLCEGVAYSVPSMGSQTELVCHEPVELPEAAVEESDLCAAFTKIS